MVPGSCSTTARGEGKGVGMEWGSWHWHCREVGPSAILAPGVILTCSPGQGSEVPQFLHWQCFGDEAIVLLHQQSLWQHVASLKTSQSGLASAAYESLWWIRSKSSWFSLQVPGKHSCIFQHSLQATICWVFFPSGTHTSSLGSGSLPAL